MKKQFAEKSPVYAGCVYVCITINRPDLALHLRAIILIDVTYN